MQKGDVNIIDIVDNVQTTKRGYEKLVKKVANNANSIFEKIPTLVALCCLIVRRTNLEVATKSLLHQQVKIPR